jgi:tetratricopeptide (TPR) repeat protein
LVIAVVVVYAPVKNYPFIILDDLAYIQSNSHLHQLNWEAVRWSFTKFYASNWQPLSWLSHALDYHFFSLNAGRHHETNMLLQGINAVLLFWVLSRATGYLGRSWIVAALFALHPINVETVAWVAERKNLLSMFFLLLTIGAYQWYARRPRVSAYVVVAVLFALALMSKPQVVTLPFLLLLWDYWPLERIAVGASRFAFRKHNLAGNSGEKGIADGEPRTLLWLMLEKLPLFAMSAACGCITLKAQRAGGAMGGALQAYSLPVRVENAIVAYARYLGKAVWPTHLAFFYAHAGSIPRLQVLESLLLLLSITALVIAGRSRRYLLVGWFWFLGTMVPMIGIVQVGGQALADRYGYLPFVGLFIAICWGVADLIAERHVPLPWMAGACAAALLLLALITRHQLSYWSDDLALWSHTVEVTGHNPGAETVVGELLQRQGRPQEAITHFRAASAMAPQLAYPHYHIAIYDEQHGDLAGALEQFRMVIAVTQGDRGLMAELRADTLSHMSRDYRAIGDYASADTCFQMGLREQQKQQAFEMNSSE